MRFLRSFFISALMACALYYALVIACRDAPIPAEYWVAELITVKQELARRYANEKKVVIAGGSSTLFGIDTHYATEQLGLPVLNFGLHAGLRLDKILSESSTAVEPGDILILALEPVYYGCNPVNSWQVRNLIGWNHEEWHNLPPLETLSAYSLVSPPMLSQMLETAFQKRFHSKKVSNRLAALDQSLVLERFRHRSPPTAFAYSAYNINAHGDMLKTEGSVPEGEFISQSYDVRDPRRACKKTITILSEFVDRMNDRGIDVYFANTPYLAAFVPLESLRKHESTFLSMVSPIGCFIDRREDLVFDRKYFFNTSLHLNAEGRAKRTDLFIQAVRDQIFTGTCGGRH